MVPAYLSLAVLEKLQKADVQCRIVTVEGEGHTFDGKVQKDLKTWKVQRTGFDWLEDFIESS